MDNIISLKNSLFLGLAAIGGYLAQLLGGWDGALRVLIGLMAADYLTGLLVAAFWQRSNKSETGALDSKASFKGLCKKGVILLLIWIGAMLDAAMKTTYVRTAVVLFFVGNEGLSLVENIGLMGIDFPPKLKKALEALRDKEGK